MIPPVTAASVIASPAAHAATTRDTAVLQQTSSISLSSATASSVSVTTHNGGSPTHSAAPFDETLRAAVLLLVLQALFGENDRPGTERLAATLTALGLLGGIGAADSEATATPFTASTFSASASGFAYVSSTTFTLSHEAATAHAAAAYQPAPAAAGSTYDRTA